ncbi:MAG: hypothetical protein V1755_06515 [Chloroflexota bacterium]
MSLHTNYHPESDFPRKSMRSKDFADLVINRPELGNPTLRKQLFNAASAVSGYFDAQNMLNKTLPYDEQLTHLARLIARELDVEEAIQ